MEQDFNLKKLRLKDLENDKKYYISLREQLKDELKNGEIDPELINIISNLDWLINYTETSLKDVLHNEECISRNR